MAERLKSILKRTSWSLVLKAVIFGVAWWALPFWLFLLIALYLYFVPFTGAGKASALFFVLLFVSLVQRQNAIAAVIFGALFYAITLVKELIIIDRRTAYEILMIALSYLLIRGFFLNAGGSINCWSLGYGLIAAWAVSAMVTSLIKNFSAADAAAPEHDALTCESRSFRRALGWTTFLLMWQLLIVGLFLPLDFLYQSAIVFLAAIVLLTLVPQYVFGEFSRMKALATGTVLFALLTIVAASARWVL